MNKKLATETNRHINRTYQRSYLRIIYTARSGLQCITTVSLLKGFSKLRMIFRRVSCQKGPICHALAWRVGPFWRNTIDIHYASRILTVYRSICTQLCCAMCVWVTASFPWSIMKAYTSNQANHPLIIAFVFVALIKIHITDQCAHIFSIICSS